MRSPSTIRVGTAALAACLIASTVAAQRVAPHAVITQEGTSLIDAAKSGDRGRALTLLAAGTDASEKDADGSTALIWAAHRNDVELVDLLLSHGADQNLSNQYGATALTLAAENGGAEIAARLLKAGANANAESRGQSVLMVAARAGNPEVIRLLVASGANPNAREPRDNQTALMWAAAANNTAAVKALVVAGADLALRSGQRTALRTGSSIGGSASTNAAFILARPKDAEEAVAADPLGVRQGTYGETHRIRGGLEFTALLFAVRGGQIDATLALLEAGADVNESVVNGPSALVLAIMNAHFELASILLDRGADPNSAQHGWTPLIQVARTRGLSAPGGGAPPQPVATGNVSSLELARKLIANGADVNARMTREFGDGYRNRMNRLGATAFLLAAKAVDLEMMQLLIEGHADPNLMTVDNVTPLMAAAGNYIFNPGEDANTNHESEPQALEAVKLCLSLGANVNWTDKNGETALHGAAYRGANSIAQLLVEKGARLDLRNREGWTPFTVARGVFYSDFHKTQPQTAALLATLMKDRGIIVDNSDLANDYSPEALNPFLKKK